MASDRRCTACNGPVREVYGHVGGVPCSPSLLYCYLVVLEAKEPVTLAANAWMCSACRIAGGILTPFERAENERRWAEIAMQRDDMVPFWRSDVSASRPITLADILRGDPA